jgi:hypothetical protein
MCNYDEIPQVQRALRYLWLFDASGHVIQMYVEAKPSSGVVCWSWNAVATDRLIVPTLLPPAVLLTYQGQWDIRIPADSS